jgi:hypothetical protein
MDLPNLQVVISFFLAFSSLPWFFLPLILQILVCVFTQHNFCIASSVLGPHFSTQMSAYQK